MPNEVFAGGVGDDVLYTPNFDRPVPSNEDEFGSETKGIIAY